MSFVVNRGSGEEERQNKIQVKLSKVNDETVCVEFMNMEGDS